MTHNDAMQTIRRLRQVRGLRVVNVDTWLALIEDELQRDVPNSQLLARFKQIKEENALRVPGVAYDVEGRLRSECTELIDAVCASLEYEPVPGAELTDEVERIIQKGYFTSIYFRAVLGGLALVLVLVTGVEGYKLNEQVKAMQQLVADARRQVEDSRIEIAKSSAETRDRQAQLALALLQGDQEMVKLRANAMQQMVLEQDTFRSRIDQKTADGIAEISKSVSDANQHLAQASDNGVAEISKKTEASDEQIDQAFQGGKSAIASKVSSTLATFDATNHPLVPAVVWSITKRWIVVPVTLIIAILAWINSFAKITESRLGSFKLGNIVVLANLVCVGGMLVLVWRS